MVEKTPAGRMTELSLISGKEVEYKVTHTAGAVHMPTFTMQGTFMNFMATGEASSKKAAKQRTANELLKILQNQPPGDQIPGLEKVLEGWNYEDLFSSEEKSPTHSTVFNAVGALFEFQAKHKSVQVVFDDLPTVEDDDAKKVFGTKCVLLGKLDDEITEPLVGTGFAHKKQLSRIKAADGIAQMLVGKGYLHPGSLKVVEEPKDDTTPSKRICDESSIKIQPSIPIDLISLDTDVTQGAVDDWSAPETDWFDPERDSAPMVHDISVPTEDHVTMEPTEQAQPSVDGVLAKGSLDKLNTMLQGTGLKIEVEIINKQAEHEGEKVVHNCVLVIKSEKQDRCDMNVNNPSWIGRHEVIAIAQDIAAHRALKQLGTDANVEMMVRRLQGTSD